MEKICDWLENAEPAWAGPSFKRTGRIIIIGSWKSPHVRQTDQNRVRASIFLGFYLWLSRLRLNIVYQDIVAMNQPSIHGQASAIPSSQAETSSPKPRSACNRCHRQKLRCIKVEGNNRCERCTNLKTECRYSPRERRAVQSRPLRKDPDAWLKQPGLVPAIAPAMSDMQQVVTSVPDNAERDWFSFEPVGMGNAEGLGKPLTRIPTLCPVVLTPFQSRISLF